MDAGVPDLVRDKQRALTELSSSLAAHRATLFVEKRSGAFQCWIARSKPNELKVEVLDGCFNQFGRLPRIGARQYEFVVDASGGVSNWFKSIHLSLRDS
jgi:hypothetical protein